MVPRSTDARVAVAAVRRLPCAGISAATRPAIAAALGAADSGRVARVIASATEWVGHLPATHTPVNAGLLAIIADALLPSRRQSTHLRLKPTGHNHKQFSDLRFWRDFYDC